MAERFGEQTRTQLEVWIDVTPSLPYLRYGSMCGSPPFPLDGADPHPNTWHRCNSAIRAISRKENYSMKNEEITLNLSVETIAVLARTESTAPRRAQDPLDLEGFSSSSTCTPRFCCP